MNSIVYVVSASPPRRRALIAALKAGSGLPEVREFTTLPAHLETSGNSGLMIDLRDHLELQERRWLSSHPAVVRVILVATYSQSIPAAWLEVAREGDVQVILASSPDTLDEARLRSAVTRAMERDLERVVMWV